MRGGNRKFRALRLDHGNFSWGSEVSKLHPAAPPVLGSHDRLFAHLNKESCPALQAITRKTRILDVVYNASNNELVGGGWVRRF